MRFGLPVGAVMNSRAYLAIVLGSLLAAAVLQGLQPGGDLVIELADVVRYVVVGGAVLALGALTRLTFDPDRNRWPMFQATIVAIYGFTLATLFVGGTELGRVGSKVTWRLPVGVGFLLVTIGYTNRLLHLPGRAWALTFDDPCSPPSSGV